jgi:opacity protein-like surface antigen
LKLRLVVCLMGLFSFGAAASYAQGVPTLEVALNYAHVSVTPTNSQIGNFAMSGADGQVAYNFNKWISGVADASYVTMKSTASSGEIGLTIHGTEIAYLAGPRVSYRHFQRFTPFAQILVGMFHDTPTTFQDLDKSQFKLGYSAGGGVDIRIKPHIAIRPVGIDVMRTQFAELGSTRQVQTNFRYTAGVVFRF